MSEWIKTSVRQPEQSGYYLFNVKWCGADMRKETNDDEKLFGRIFD